MSLGFDPEVPAGYQDADIEMAEMAAAADEPPTFDTVSWAGGAVHLLTSTGTACGSNDTDIVGAVYDLGWVGSYAELWGNDEQGCAACAKAVQ